MTRRLFIAARNIGSRLAIAPFRVIAYFFHATGLERFYKPRFARYAALTELDEALAERLPKYAHTISGAKSDPMNLVFVGDEVMLRRTFRQAKWRRAHPASPIHVTYALFKTIFRRSYERGPFAPLYVNIGLQDLAYQRSTVNNSSRERHHLRIWRTGIILSDGRRVWVAAAGRENGMRLALALPFWTHALDPNLDREREFVVGTLVKHGATRLKTLPMTSPVPASEPHKTVFGSQYYTDGRAAVVQF